MKAKAKKLFNKIGPGFITGASDDDPSGIATYSQTGAIFGYGQLWLALFSLPFMIVIQKMCGRIGLVTGKGLSGVIRIHYPKPVLYFAVCLLLLANTFNIGADLGAMAASAQMLTGLPYLFWLVFMTLLILGLEIFVAYKSYARILKYLTFSLFAYVITAFVVEQDWKQILVNTIWPQIQFTEEYILNVVAALGTTISPYLFFWQASVEVEEELVAHKLEEMGLGIPLITQQDIRDMSIDTVAGMFFSQVIMFFIIITTASTLHVHGITNIDTAPQAAEALRPLAGDLAYLLFAVGIIGTGLLAVPILAGSASYAVAETMGWEAGLSKKFHQAQGFYGVIILSTLIGMITNFMGIDPIKALYYSAAFNGLAAPPLMVLIVMIASNSDIMGPYINKKITTFLGWIVILAMAFAGVTLLWNMFK